jgi:uncharacterized protein YlxP (DUF503 family)
MIKSIDLMSNLNCVGDIYNNEETLYTDIFISSVDYKDDYNIFKLAVEGVDLDCNVIERNIEVKARYFWKEPEKEIEKIRSIHKTNNGFEKLLFESILKSMDENWDYDEALEKVEVYTISDHVFVAKFEEKSDYQRVSEYLQMPEEMIESQTSKEREVSYYEFIVKEI